MNKTIFKFLTLSMLFVTGLPQAAGMLGVSTYAATKAVDAIMLGLSFWTVVALLASSGGAVAAVWWTIKSLIKKAGRSAAIAW